MYTMASLFPLLTAALHAPPELVLLWTWRCLELLRGAVSWLWVIAEGEAVWTGPWLAGASFLRPRGIPVSEPGLECLTARARLSL